LERLGADPSANHENIAKTLEALEYKRSEILQELEPRRSGGYRVLAGIQDSAREFLASQAEKDYEQLNKIVTNLVLFANGRKPSQVILSDVIKQVAVEIKQSSDAISPYRLRLAYKIDELIKVISSRLVLGSNNSETDSNYQSLISELRSQINLLSDQFNGLLNAQQANQAERETLLQEISNRNRNISDLYRDKLNLETDIAALRKNSDALSDLLRDKQNEIDGLQNLIDELKRNIGSSVENFRRRQSEIDKLKNQLSKLNQEKQDLTQRIQSANKHALRKESEVSGLQSEKSQLNLQKLELERQYQSLYKNYQQQQNEMADLKKKLEDLSQANQAKSSASTGMIARPSIKAGIATKPSISPKEWERIHNQSDYYYVKRHLRKGRWVRAHYRRNPRKKL
jgi:chromosome segregation ATPase